MLRLTVATHSFECIPLEGTLAIAQSMGFKGVDIAGFHKRGKASYEPDEVASAPKKYASHLKKLLDKYKLDAIDFFPQFGVSFYERSMNDPDASVRRQNVKAMRGIVKFCAAAGIPGVTVLPGVDHLGVPQKKNLDVAGATFRQLVEICNDAGVQLGFEAHMGSLTDTPELALELVERAPGLTITLDYSHFTLQYIEVERIHKMIPHAGHIHLRPARAGKLQTRYVDNTIDWADIIKRLEAVDYKGCVSVEYVCADWFGANELDTLNETMVTKEALQPLMSL